LPADPLVEVDDIFVPPVGVVAVSDDHIGGLDKGPLEIGVALLDDSGLGRRWR